jgi:hypothetical protein
MSSDVDKERHLTLTKRQARGATFILFVVAACLGNVAFIGTDTHPKNLIPNSSFEIGTSPTLQGWVVDSTWVDYVKDAPTRGGQWSIKLEAGWAPQEGFAETCLSGESGRNIYRLTAWMKTLHQWTGTISLGIRKSGQTLMRKSISSHNPQWTAVSLSDTLSLGRSDSLIVRLSAGMTEVRRGEVLFDLVQLERVPTQALH